MQPNGPHIPSEFSMLSGNILPFDGGIPPEGGDEFNTYLDPIVVLRLLDGALHGPLIS